MKAEVIDQSAYFPACAVLPWWDKPVYSTATLATTMNAGWTWQIGLKERTGQGYLYDPNYLTKDQALDEIRNKFGQHVEPVASLQFTPSIMKQSQVKNVIGIGLSTGFMEPLEANGTGIIVDQLLALLDNWSPVEYNALNEKHFNENVLEKYLGIRDFLSLHYRGKGNESNFWKEQADPNRVPETLKEKLSEFERFYATGKMDFAKYLNGFSIESWLTVIQGIGIIDSKAISVGDKHHFIDNYYKETVKPFDHIYRRCIKIEKWIDKTSNIA
jgi:tryptophan halogenase